MFQSSYLNYKLSLITSTITFIGNFYLGIYLLVPHSTSSFGFNSSMFKRGWNLEGCFLCLSPHSHSKSQEYRPILFISSVIIPSRLWPQLTVEIPIKVVGQDNTRDNLIERSSLDNYKLRRDVGTFQEDRIWEHVEVQTLGHEDGTIEH